MKKAGKKSNRPVGLGIIGTGEIARIIRPAFTGSEEVRVVAVADVNHEAACAEAEALGGADAFADYRKLLAHPEVQAVYIATPPFLHREMVLAAMAAGKHVLCEKPFMLNQAEAREIAAAHAETRGLKVACCSSRFHAGAPVRKARELIANGAIGGLQRNGNALMRHGGSRPRSSVATAVLPSPKPPPAAARRVGQRFSEKFAAQLWRACRFW